MPIALLCYAFTQWDSTFLDNSCQRVDLPQIMTSKSVPLRLIAFLGFAALANALLMLPAAWVLRRHGPVRLNGIETVDDALIACQRVDLSGWELVTYAQRLVYHKFTHYSCRNLWDTPTWAFRRGMGYCTQYNLTLKEILDRLGFETQAVFSLRVRVDDNPAWTMGHTWLRVTIDGETWDVCAGHRDNWPGQVNFAPLAPVWSGNRILLLLTHLGMIGFGGWLEWRAMLNGCPLPAWMFKERSDG